MKYLCLVFPDHEKLTALSREEAAALDAASLAYDQQLKQRGIFLAAQALQSASTAKTLRQEAGRVVVSDGPFTETKEHVGGFILIEVKDMQEAVEVASRIPALQLGNVEVRPIYELQPDASTDR